MHATAQISQDSDSERPTKVVSKSRKKHSIYSHFPNDRNCEVCLRTRMTRAPCRRRTGEALEKFGDLIPEDHNVLNEEGESRNNHQYAVVVQDLATQWIEWKVLRAVAKKKKTSYLYGQSWNHRTSTLHRSETNGVAERAVRRVKEGTSAVLLQSGLNEKWWAASLECYCYLRNVQDLLAVGKTPYERRFGEPFKWPTIPFGAMVEWHPISVRGQSRLHQLGAGVAKRDRRKGDDIKMWLRNEKTMCVRFSLCSAMSCVNVQRD